MELTEKTEISKIEVVGKYNHVQVREDVVIERNGEEIARTHQRYTVAPGDDHTKLDPKVRAICEVVHIPEVIQAYQQAQQQEI